MTSFPIPNSTLPERLGTLQLRSPQTQPSDSIALAPCGFPYEAADSCASALTRARRINPPMKKIIPAYMAPLTATSAIVSFETFRCTTSVHVRLGNQLRVVKLPTVPHNLRKPHKTRPVFRFVCGMWEPTLINVCR